MRGPSRSDPHEGICGPHHQRSANTRGLSHFDPTPRRTLVLGTAGTLAVYDVAAATGVLSLTLTRPPRLPHAQPSSTQPSTLAVNPYQARSRCARPARSARATRRRRRRERCDLDRYL